ncbi:MAG TPA: hypothetical protein VJ904_06790 [Tichowtungia sp.]|nr:hypothetical protein [Tichowtungia sp.]
MSNYSINGSPAFDEQVDRHMQRIADEVWTSSYSRHWKALVLTGSYGRGEGTAAAGADGTERPFGDYNLVVVTTKINSLICGALNLLGKRLTAGLGMPVTLRPFLRTNLSKKDLSLLNYNLKYGHQVIRGNAKILDRMPDVSPEQIPLSEGPRLLMNRGKLLLDMRRRLATKEMLTPEERLQFIRYILKANLAFGDCVLLMRNAYVLSCAVKKERIRQIDLTGISDARGLVNAYLDAVKLKEQGNLKLLETANMHMWLDETAQRFQDVFLWYERRGLNRKFHDIKRYAKAFPKLGKEGSPLQNVACNLKTFGPAAVSHPLVHPRLRLYPSILLLLDDHADLEDVRKLLHFPDGTFGDLCDYFGQLQQRFS